MELTQKQEQQQQPVIMTDTAYLEIILGPMYASKTTRLVEIYKKCVFCDISVLVINHSCDTRYDTTLMTTHDNIQVPCIMVDKLMDIWFDPTMISIDLETDVLKRLRSDVILINEGQFFPDLEEFVKQMLSCNKRIYVCGLDGDFERKKFGQILDLIPLCDKVTKLTSLCHLCKNGTPGIFSKRLSLETEQTVVGSDNYISVCRKCYEK
jgi:thymidine kinase